MLTASARACFNDRRNNPVPFTSTQRNPMSQQSARESGQAAKFLLGQIVATPNALDQIPNAEILKALSRHVAGDWGELEAEDRDANENALKQGGRLFSRYVSTRGIPFWIITEWNRSVTTVLLPEDY